MAAGLRAGAGGGGGGGTERFFLFVWGGEKEGREGNKSEITRRNRKLRDGVSFSLFFQSHLVGASAWSEGPRGPLLRRSCFDGKREGAKKEEEVRRRGGREVEQSVVVVVVFVQLFSYSREREKNRLRTASFAPVPFPWRRRWAQEGPEREARDTQFLFKDREREQGVSVRRRRGIDATVALQCRASSARKQGSIRPPSFLSVPLSLCLNV